MPEAEVRTWVLHYQWHGIVGLQPKRSRYSVQFKRRVLAHQDREQLSDRQIAAIYDIRNGNQVTVWRRKLAIGEDDTSDDASMTDTQEDEPAVPAQTAAGEQARALLEENERLRAEVACLKKLHALIRTRRSAAPTRRASSSD